MKGSCGSRRHHVPGRNSHLLARLYGLHGFISARIGNRTLSLTVRAVMLSEDETFSPIPVVGAVDGKAYRLLTEATGYQSQCLA